MSNQIQITKLKGPIAIFGAGGFVGINLLNSLLKVRNDIIGFSQNPQKSWRIKANKIPDKNIARCNLLVADNIESVIKKYRPKTIFNLAAYGAYSKQKDIERIYQTNFNSTACLIESLKKYGFNAYIHAGSQSEYGLNSAGPSENAELFPNSHYAVSKVACYHLLKYYGKVERLPVAHLRLYSVYGPWEEPGRLIPVLIEAVRRGKLPPFVDPNISRDFVYIDDVIEAMTRVAKGLRKDHYGEVFNIATGKKTTIKALAYLAKKLFKIKGEPKFGSFKNRDWDVLDWYGNPKKIYKEFGWKAKISLEEGLIRFFNHIK